MSDTVTTEKPCDGYVGNGIVRFACTFDHPHDGPGVAVEYPVSKLRREQWERKQQESGPVEIQTSPTPAPLSGPQQVDGQPVRFSSTEQRLAEARKSMFQEVDQLPPVLRSWLLGATAQLALVELYRAFKAAEAAGVPFVLSGADIEALVPDKLRA